MDKLIQIAIDAIILLGMRYVEPNVSLAVLLASGTSADSTTTCWL